jgi:drug/metabolite transporter (DMT)-like permease
MTALRFSLAALLLFPFLFRGSKKIDRGVFRSGFTLGILIFLGFILQTVGLAYTTASKSAFITSMMVVFTPLFQFALLRRWPRPENLIGVTIVSAGLWFLTQPTGGALNRGDLLTLLSAVVFSLYIVSLDSVSRKHDPFHLTFAQAVAPAVYSWIALFFIERPFFHPTAAAFSTLGYTALLATIGAGYLQTRYQRDTTPTRAALIFALEPVWAAMLGFFFLQERLGLSGLIGGGLIIVGILFSELPGAIRGETVPAAGKKEGGPL